MVVEQFKQTPKLGSWALGHSKSHSSMAVTIERAGSIGANQALDSYEQGS